MLTRTSQYALRASIHLVRNAHELPQSAGQIARQTDIPHRYLSTILGELTQAGVLKSARGKGGGFRLTRSPQHISLYEIVARFESAFIPQRSCPFGNAACGDDNPCLAHNGWKAVLETEQRFLQHTTLYDVSIERSTFSERGNKEGASNDALAVL